MEISVRTTANLLLLNETSTENLRSLCKYFLQALVTGASTTVVDTSLEDQLCALSTFLLETGKLRSTSETVRKLLSQNGLKDEVSAIISEVYDKYHPMIFTHMNATGIAVPAIVGFVWRADSTIEDGCVVPLFLLTLKVSDRGILRNIEMLASRDTLQDLLYKVKDAAKQADRIINSISRSSV